MLGPDYALLQPEYANLRDRVPPREGLIRKVLVYFGGSDIDNWTGKTIEVLQSINRPSFHVDVVINRGNLNLDSIKKQIGTRTQFMLHVDLPSLAPLIASSDISIGAAGTTTWERCCLGLPSIVISLAENQIPIASKLDQLKLVRWLGHKDKVSISCLKDALDGILDTGLSKAWSERCTRELDGRGAIRVASTLMVTQRSNFCVRPARVNDENLILRLAQGRSLQRGGRLETNQVDPSSTRAWVFAALRDIENCHIYILETEDQERWPRKSEQP